MNTYSYLKEGKTDMGGESDHLKNTRTFLVQYYVNEEEMYVRFLNIN
jgi:hypothetical protein